MKILLTLIGIIAIGGLIHAEKTRYDNYKLVRLSFGNDEHIKLVESLKDASQFDIWTGNVAVNESIDVMLSPQEFKEYEPLFENAQMEYKILRNNIQEEVDAQEVTMKFNSLNRNLAIVGKYARYADIISYISTIVSQNSGIASSYSAGTTYENRDLRVIVLKGPSASRKVWIDCGIHAREWVSISSCIWMIDKLVSEYKANDTVTVPILNKYEIHILPLVNPDGYEYSHTNTRLWRKNKKPNTGSSCIGIDLNRNFDYQFMVSGSSNQPCAETYAGPSGSSENEVKAIQKAIRNSLGLWDIFVTIHSYGAFWMPPWAYTSTPPADYNELASYATIGTNAIRAVNGLQFKIGPPHVTVQYSASGGSYDWAKAIAGVKYAYCLELRPSQTSTESFYGFQLPESYAPTVGQETYAGLKAMIDAIRKK